MASPRQYGLFNTLRVQLLVYMVLLITVPILFMAIFGNFFYAQAIDEQANRYSRQMLEQVQINIDSTIHQVDQVIAYLILSEEIQTFLNTHDFYSPERIEAETGARAMMGRFVDANPGLISGILVASRHNLYASNEMYRISRFPLTEDDWYVRAIEEGGDRALISRPIGRNIRNYKNPSADDIVSAVRSVVDPVTGEALGVICVDMPLKVIESHIRDLTLGKSGYVFLMDDEGQMVYAPVNQTVYRIKREWLTGDDALSLHTIGRERYQLVSIHSSLANWRTTGVFRSGEILEPVLQLRYLSMILALIAVLVATVTALSFSTSFTKPISRLRMLMADAEKGNLNIRFEEQQHHGEIAQLGSSFNNMMEQIRNLIDLVYIEQKNKREADIKTLQAQIKPHFLYNTLETIRWMAEERGAPEIVSIIAALTKLFRIGISRGKEVISLSEELEHVLSYLYIQQVRYEDKLSYEIDVDDACLGDRVHKLILQPLVENAIYHGIKQKRGAGHIRIAGYERDGELVIEIRDDGAGMTREKCDALNRALRAARSTTYDHGYGIFNVNDRIRLSYGEPYGLYYALNEEGGVTVTILHPIIHSSAQPAGREERG